MAKITFLQGTPQQYASLKTKDANTLYFIFEKSAATASLYLGERYVAGITNLTDLYDVTTSNLADNDVLVYNTVKNVWENITMASLATKIAVELGYATLQSAVTTLNDTIVKKANADDVYTKTETDVAISTAITSISHLKRIIVDSVEKIDADADDALNYIYMVPTGTVYGDNKYDEYLVIESTEGARSKERVGSWEVNLSDYAKISDVTTALAGKADKSTSLSGYGITDAYTKTEVDTITTTITNDLAAEVKRSTDKDSAIDSSIATINTKLSGIDSGAQVNSIDSVDANEFNLVAKNLELKAVPAAKITGLDVHDVIKTLNTAIGVNTTNIATNTTNIQNAIASLNNYVRQEKYNQDIAALSSAVSWHQLHS